MTVTLVLSDSLADELLEATGAPVESAGVLLARYVETPEGNTRLLARQMCWVPEEAYQVRCATELKVSSHGYVPALASAEADGCVPIWLHTHPGDRASPKPSRRDEIVDGELADLFRIRSGSELYGAVVVARDSGQLTFTGHIESTSAQVDVDRLWATGRRFYLVKNWLHTADEVHNQFDRNIRAFGGGIQKVLSDLSVAVVGCGGTGSAVVEQLVRLGVRHMRVFDPDTLTESNTTRVYGSYRDDVGKPKVHVSSAHAARIAPDVEVLATQKTITTQAAAKLLIDADVIFGCTDDNSGRLVLSRIASYLLTPVIDCGVLLTSGRNGRLDGIYGRVTVLGPGAACLVCRKRIDLERAAAEMLPTDEHQRLVGEGYAPALPGIEPAVVTFTTQVAAAAVSELLERLIRYGPEPAPTEILLRAHDREVSTNDQDPQEGHYCHPDSGKLGLGLTFPFLEQTWRC